VGSDGNFFGRKKDEPSWWGGERKMGNKVL